MRITCEMRHGAPPSSGVATVGSLTQDTTCVREARTFMPSHASGHPLLRIMRVAMRVAIVGKSSRAGIGVHLV